MDINRIKQLAGIQLNEDELDKANVLFRKLERVLNNLFDSLEPNMSSDDKVAIIKHQVDAVLKKY